MDVVLEDGNSSSSEKVALIEVKVSEAELDEASLWSDAVKLWELQVREDQSGHVEVQAKRFVVNVVRGLAAGTTPSTFEASVKALVDKSQSWEPRFGAVFSAVFPVFSLSNDGSGGQRSAMWEICGVAGFELQARAGK